MLEALHTTLLEMYQNNLINIAGKHILEIERTSGTDPKTAMIEYNGEYVTVYTAAQAISCRHFLQQASSIACLFEDDARHVGLPTQTNWFHTKQ